MKKFAAILFSASVILLVTPTVSLAANLTNLNGLTTATQTFATSTAPNSPHLLIQSSGSVHTFKWNGTPWLLNQGGTGATSFSTSSIPFINNGVFSQNNLQFFWDTVNNALNIGGTTTPSARLSIRGSGSWGPLNIASSTGASLFYINGAGNVGINTTSPSEKLDVVGNGKFSGSLQVTTLGVSATSTIAGPVSIGNSDPKSALDVSGAMYSRLVTASGSNIDWNAGNVQSITLSSNSTLTFLNGQAGGEYKLILNQDSAGGRTITWPSSVKWENKTTPILASTTNAIDMADFTFDGTSYLGSFASNFGVPPSSAQVQVLVVAGGGAGARGGGGAGGYQYNPAYTVASGTPYTVTVGDGGIMSSQQGGNSVFDTITSIGGGHGTGGADGTSGGSGGGGSCNNGVSNGGAGTVGQGNAGGSNNGMYSPPYPAGGGGGAGAVGNVPVNSTTAGAGGDGVMNPIAGSTAGQNIAGTYWLAGGGGGGTYSGGTSAGGGKGGGGAGATASAATSATANTGGGGGGGCDVGSSDGDGGPGVVVISYPTGSISATGGTVTTSGGNTIHTFTSSGTFTVTAIY